MACTIDVSCLSSLHGTVPYTRLSSFDCIRPIHNCWSENLNYIDIAIINKLYWTKFVTCGAGTAYLSGAPAFTLAMEFLLPNLQYYAQCYVDRYMFFCFFFLLAIVLSVLLCFMASGLPLWYLQTLSLLCRSLLFCFVFFGHCIVCSSIFNFFLSCVNILCLTKTYGWSHLLVCV